MISARLTSNLLHEISQRACNEFSVSSNIGKALSLSQRKWRCGKTRLCSFKWRAVSHMSVCPVSSLVLYMSRFVKARSRQMMSKRCSKSPPKRKVYLGFNTILRRWARIPRASIRTAISWGTVFFSWGGSKLDSHSFFSIILVSKKDIHIHHITLLVGAFNPFEK